eukprot:m.228657 g.228657  ORF g.228657 m.228657 type:complete len:76 (+) comp18830_c0_seq12:662-889(+)
MRHAGYRRQVGVDIAPTAVNAMQRASQELPGVGELDFVVGDAARLPFAKQSFDCVLETLSVPFVKHAVAHRNRGL